MKTAKKRPKTFVPGQDLNPRLQIQSQLCLPLDQGFKKNAWKTKINRPGLLKFRFYTVFDNELSSKLYQKLKNFPNYIVISFSAK